MGDNINALIRVTEWVGGRLGRYYLYFSGAFRLAYADALTGPWTPHTPGVLDRGVTVRSRRSAAARSRPAALVRIEGRVSLCHVTRLLDDADHPSEYLCACRMSADGSVHSWAQHQRPVADPRAELGRGPAWPLLSLFRGSQGRLHSPGLRRRVLDRTLPLGTTPHTPGVLDVAESLFEAVDPPEPPEADRPPWAEKLKGGYLYAHVASPDVDVDHGDRRIRMYYHGLLWNGYQQTRLATSCDGVRFEPLEPLLGPPYFRAFEYAGYVYALVGSGGIWRARRRERPFEHGPNIIASAGGGGIDNGCRHGAVHRVADRLHVFYTRKGERPEGILHAVVDLTRHWTDWVARDPVTVLRTGIGLGTSGADLPLGTSIMGARRRPTGP